MATNPAAVHFLNTPSNFARNGLIDNFCRQRPTEITRVTALLAYFAFTFPNEGLTFEEIARAIYQGAYTTDDKALVKSKRSAHATNLKAIYGCQLISTPDGLGWMGTNDSNDRVTGSLQPKLQRIRSDNNKLAEDIEAFKNLPNLNPNSIRLLQEARIQLEAGQEAERQVLLLISGI